MSAVLITGATSFLGHALGKRLSAENTDVHVLVRQSSDRSRFGDWPRAPTFHVVDGTYQSVHAGVEASRADLVYHLATRYLRHHEPEDIPGLIDTNIRFGADLLEAMANLGRRKLVNSATFFQHFEDDGYRPLNLYAATKQSFECIFSYYDDCGLIESATLVFHEIYGPGDWRSKVVPAVLAAQAAGNPVNLADRGTLIDLVFIDDAVEALLRVSSLLAEQPESIRGGRFAVRSPAPVSLGGLIEAFEAVNGREIDANWNAYRGADREMKGPWQGPLVPGWEATTGLAEGIAKLSGPGS